VNVIVAGSPGPDAGVAEADTTGTTLAVWLWPGMTVPVGVASGA
jgi:hypothetical protein